MNNLPIRPEVARSWRGQEQGTFPARRSLLPLEQHKADLEMIIAACVTGAGMTGEAACTAIAKLANSMLVRLDGHTVVDGKCSCVGDQP